MVANLMMLFLAAASPASIEERQLTRARDELRRALREEPKFIKVHAAEALLDLDLGQDVRRVFEDEQRLHADEPAYRVGIWRVLARAAKTPAERQAYVDKILAVYADPKASDSVHAVESLAKLEYAVPERDRAALQAWTENPGTERQGYGRWLLAVSGTQEDVERLAELLADERPVTRGVAAYALRFMPKRITPEVIDKIAAAADSVRPDDLRGHLIGAAYATAPHGTPMQRFRELLLNLTRDGTRTDKCEALNGIASRGDAADVPLAVQLLGDPDADVRVSAARTLLTLTKR